MSKVIEAPTQVEQPPSVSFNFTEKFKAPSNFKDLNLNDPVRVIVHGNIKSLAQGKNYDGKTFQDFSIEMDRVEVNQSSPKTIAEAKTIARERVKDFK